MAAHRRRPSNPTELERIRQEEDRGDEEGFKVVNAAKGVFYEGLSSGSECKQKFMKENRLGLKYYGTRLKGKYVIFIRVQPSPRPDEMCKN